MIYRIFRGRLPQAVNPRRCLASMLRRQDPSRAAAERARMALNTLTGRMLVVDSEGYVMLANPGFAALFGHKRRALTGQALDALAWQDLQGNPAVPGSHPWEMALRKGAPVRRHRVWLADHLGVRHAFLANCSPILSANGEYGGVTISLEDVAGLDSDAIELAQAGTEAVATSHATDLLLADAAHEIRSSLNSTLGFTDLLRRGQFRDEADYRRHLDIVHSSSTHLLDLINDMLDISSLESGRLEVKQGDCAAYRIAHEVVQALSIKARAKGVSLELDCPGAIPACIQSDSARVRQIVSNLVSHVIAFADGGSVKVALRFVAARPQAQLLVSISNAGTGMAEHRPEALFEPFVQAGRTVTRRIDGSGRGLTLSHRLARAIGGELLVRRVPGAASTFTLKLPAGPIESIRLITPEQAAADQGGVNPAFGSRWQLSPVRVLIVDDAPENRELVRLVLEDAGATTEQAENGLVAVERARSRRYDLIIMDLQMPGVDGITATRLLRQYGLNTPIVALTAHAIKGLEQNIIDAGCTACLAKPIEIDQLLSTIAALVGGRRVYEPLNKPAAPPINPVESKILPPTPIVSRLAGNTRLQSAIDQFTARLDGQLRAIEQAWQARDFGALASLAHWLKGAGGTVGFDSFNEPARKLEQLSKANLAEGMEEVLMELKYISARIVRPPVAANAPAPDQSRTNP